MDIYVVIRNDFGVADICGAFSTYENAVQYIKGCTMRFNRLVGTLSLGTETKQYDSWITAGEQPIGGVFNGSVVDVVDAAPETTDGIEFSYLLDALYQDHLDSWDLLPEYRVDKCVIDEPKDA